jgi:hypothetical protein
LFAKTYHRSRAPRRTSNSRDRPLRFLTEIWARGMQTGFGVEGIRRDVLGRGRLEGSAAANSRTGHEKPHTAGAGPICSGGLEETRPTLSRKRPNKNPPEIGRRKMTAADMPNFTFGLGGTKSPRLARSMCHYP